ncbi:MAG: glutathione S-transferase N-terminal domain-containing protein [Gammaproteobacteria bacterium]|nr:glutathione S-transferase N-terminal domain-containing protein [Gammaproteobacteria bacterium]
MKLYYSNASPYARTAQVVLREIAIDNAELDPQVIEVPTHPFDNEPEFLTANPLGKVPCLILESGQSVFDSEVICQYLDAKFNHGKFWQPIANDWQLRCIYSEISGLLDLAVALRQEKMREAESLRSDFWWSRFESGLSRGMQWLTKRITEVPESINLININLICLMDYLSFRHPEFANFNESLLSRYEVFTSRETFVNTKPRD